MNNKEIIIPLEIYNKLIEKGFAELPFETCGMLSGNNSCVKSLWNFNNEIISTNRFYVSKQIVEETIQNIDALQEQVLALYHTHPTTAPIPSSIDLVNHPDDQVDMVIISFKTRPPKMSWYSIQAKKYAERLFYIN